MANYDVESHTYLNHTKTHRSLVQGNVCFFYFWYHMLVRPVMKRLFFRWKTKEKQARFARAPHYKGSCPSYYRTQPTYPLFFIYRHTDITSAPRTTRQDIAAMTHCNTTTDSASIKKINLKNHNKNGTSNMHLKAEILKSKTKPSRKNK